MGGLKRRPRARWAPGTRRLTPDTRALAVTEVQGKESLRPRLGASPWPPEGGGSGPQFQGVEPGNLQSASCSSGPKGTSDPLPPPSLSGKNHPQTKAGQAEGLERRMLQVWGRASAATSREARSGPLGPGPWRPLQPLGR